jgi:putative colanic acid biosynthesis acetyltransferase WcaF
MPTDAPASLTPDTTTTAAASLRAREQSPWSFGMKVRRVLWMFAQGSLFRCSFHNWYGWRRFVLRAFGATIGPRVRVRPTVRIEMPWNLDLGEAVIVGDYAILYSLAKITVGPFSVISQYSHLCAGTHDHTKRSFPLVCEPITIGREAWIAADVFVGPGVTVGDRSVVGARSSVFADVPPDVIAAGTPAKVLKPRLLTD